VRFCLAGEAFVGGDRRRLRVVGGDRLTMPLDERYLVTTWAAVSSQPSSLTMMNVARLLCTSPLKKRRKTTTGNVNRLAI